MAALAVLWSVLAALSPTRLAGPLLDKDLRVASRRRRTYVLRALYLAALIGYILIVWGSQQRQGIRGQGFAAATMSDAGRLIVTQVAWFQLIAMLLLSVTIVSGSVSAEIRQRTLPMLLTTPTSDFKIVLGKLLGGLLPLGSLLLVSFPMLAVIRVLGGVTWSFVLASLCITAAATFQMGVITQFFSIKKQEPVSVIFRSILVFGVLTGSTPLGCGCEFLSPFMALIAAESIGPRYAGILPIYFGLAISSSLLLLWHNSRILRKNALKGPSAKKLRAIKASPASLPPPPPDFLSKKRPSAPRPDAADSSDSNIRRVTGSPLVWKELVFFTSGNRRRTLLGVLAALAIIAISYAGMVRADYVHDGQVIYLYIYFLAGLMVTLVLAPMCLTSEKQTQALCALLTTPLSDWHIILAKALGVFKRAMAVWLLMTVHIIAFGAAGILDPIVGLQLLLLAAISSILLIGLGLLLSSIFTSSSWAVATNMAILGTLWIVGPVLAKTCYELRPLYDPLVQLSPVNLFTEALFGSPTTSRIPLNDGEFASHLTVATIVFTLAGLLMTWGAKRRLRKDLF